MYRLSFLLLVLATAIGIVDGQAWVEQSRERLRGYATVEDVDWDSLTRRDPPTVKVVCVGDRDVIGLGTSERERESKTIGDHDVISVENDGATYVVTYDKPGTSTFKYSYQTSHLDQRGRRVENYHKGFYEYRVWRCVNYFPKPTKQEDGKLKVACGMNLPGVEAANIWSLNGTELPLLENKTETTIDPNDASAHGMYSCEQWFPGQGGRQHAIGKVFVGVAPSPTVDRVTCFSEHQDGSCRTLAVDIAPPKVRDMATIRVVYRPMTGGTQAEATKRVDSGPLSRTISVKLQLPAGESFHFPGVVTAQLRSNLGIDGLNGSLIVDSAPLV